MLFALIPDFPYDTDIIAYKPESGKLPYDPGGDPFVILLKEAF